MTKVNEPTWDKVLNKEYTKPYYVNLHKQIQADKQNNKVVLPFPSEHLMFRALHVTPLDSVKVVVIGQDPYPSRDSAMGLAFSAWNETKTPATLNNIFKELKSDLSIQSEMNDLTLWAIQGVLLLNTVLTTNDGEINAHKDYGWETFTDEIIKSVCQNRQYTIYWLLGHEAQKKEQLIKSTSSNHKYDIIKLPHPSPQSAHTGFFWSKPFSRTNNLLMQNNIKPIDWRI